VTYGVTSMIPMDRTLILHLHPNPEMAGKLLATLERFNEACNWLGSEAFASKCANKVALQREYYGILRDKFGLQAQTTVRAVSWVSEVFSKDRTKPPKFDKHGKMPLDRKMISFRWIDRASILVLSGRVVVPFHWEKTLAPQVEHKYGREILLLEDGVWKVRAGVHIPEVTSQEGADSISPEKLKMILAPTIDECDVLYDLMKQVVRPSD